MRRLIFGCGYLGLRVAHRWLSQGDEVFALTRSEKRANELAELGIRPILGDVTEMSGQIDLPEVKTCLYAIGYDRSATASKRSVYVEGLKNALGTIDGKCGQLLYVSSSSVYGQNDGSLVDESSLTQPNSEGGQICLEAEGIVRTSQLAGGNWTIFRLSGIYGPGRLLAKAEQLFAQIPFGGEPDAWLNLIHVDDAADVLCTAAKIKLAGETVLVTDDQPISRFTYYTELANLLGSPGPVFSERAEPGRTRGANKQLVNANMKSKLGVSLRFPTIREGLMSSI